MESWVNMLQNIMLSYYKRITCQQSFSCLFEDISKERVQLDLVTRIIDILWELVDVICSIVGIGFIELQEQLIKDERTTAISIRILPEKILEEVA